MRYFGSILSIALLVMAASASFAAEKTINLSIPDMNCPSCPYMIEQSISFVEGVISADAVLETKTCSVTYDDAIASVDDILRATVDIGFKSMVIPGDGS